MCNVQCVIDARRVFSARGNEQWWICWHQLPCAMDMFFDQVHNHWIQGIKNKNVKWQKKFSGFDFFNMIVQTILQWQFDSFNISISFISHGLDFFHSKRLLVRWKCDKRGKVPQSAPVTPNGDPGPLMLLPLLKFPEVGNGGKITLGHVWGQVGLEWVCTVYKLLWFSYGGVKRKMEKFYRWES